MLPKFPHFKSLELSDREVIESYTKQYPPYSDYNFESLWCWDIGNRVKFSILNRNLVIQFTDYLTGNLFLSFLGNYEPVATVKTLVDFAKKNGMESRLKLLPEINFTSGFKVSGYELSQDNDNFDYIYSTEELAKYEGQKYAQCRKMANRFEKRNENIRIELFDLSEMTNRLMVLELNEQWQANKEVDFDNSNEKEALTRLLVSVENFSLINLGLFIKDKLVAFTINEKVNKGYSISHFAKFNLDYVGIYSYLMKETAKKLFEEGCQFINCEQDLGLEGLRYTKLAFRPINFLKKYSIQKGF